MGQTLSEPKVDKLTTAGENKKLYFGASCMQGWRISMEDAHTTKTDLEKAPGFSFFGVFDGHGGHKTAEFSGATLHELIIDQDSFKKGNYPHAIKTAYLTLDEHLKEKMKNDPDMHNDSSGCTAVVALHTNDHRLYVGNAGDSRAVLSSNGLAVDLSSDHKPRNTSEYERIRAAGGWVDFDRVNGNLALSRALGDFDFKQNTLLPPEKQMVTADPEVSERNLSDDDEFYVLACDGIWDCYSSQQVISFVRNHIAQGYSLEDICEMLMERCLASDEPAASVGADNMTLVIVAILNGKTKEEFYQNIHKRVQKDITEGIIYDDIPFKHSTTQHYSPVYSFSFSNGIEAQDQGESDNLESSPSNASSPNPSNIDPVSSPKTKAIDSDHSIKASDVLVDGS